MSFCILAVVFSTSSFWLPSAANLVPTLETIQVFANPCTQGRPHKRKKPARLAQKQAMVPWSLCMARKVSTRKLNPTMMQTTNTTVSIMHERPANADRIQLQFPPKITGPISPAHRSKTTPSAAIATNGQADPGTLHWELQQPHQRDRKSTRLNSSHLGI